MGIDIGVSFETRMEVTGIVIQYSTSYLTRGIGSVRRGNSYESASL